MNLTRTVLLNRLGLFLAFLSISAMFSVIFTAAVGFDVLQPHPGATGICKDPEKYGPGC